MKTSLTELSMRQYIELVCGDTSVLHKRAEIVTPGKLQEVRGRIMFEFAELSNPVTARSFTSKHEKIERAKAELMLFHICEVLLSNQNADEVRRILATYGINVSCLSEKQIGDEIGRLIMRAKREHKRLSETSVDEDKDESSPDQIRKSFDRQTSSLMAYFKFQINLDEMPASQYACLIDQAEREIKSKISAMNKR